MKATVIKMLAPILLGSATSALAATGAAEQAGNGMLIWCFIGFGMLVLLFQATPAMITFYSMLKGLFSTSPAEATFSPFKNNKQIK